jgi:F-type H+-transporting ATPase subunit epsilon
MTERELTLEIVTPDGECLREEVQSLTAPSVDGEFGVMPGHRPLLAALATGIVSFRKAGIAHRVAVGAGFIEVHEDRAVLLTDRFIEKADVDPVRARLELKEADEALERHQAQPDGPEYGAALLQELWAAVQLELYGDPPPARNRTATELQVATRQDFVSTGLHSEVVETASESGPGDAPSR